MNAAEIMTPTVITVAPQTSVAAVAELLLRHGISGAPVVEDGQVIGVVSEGDLIRRLAPAAPQGLLAVFLSRTAMAQHYLHDHGAIAADVMTSPALTVTPETGTAEIAALMETRRIKRLPVVDASGTLLGIVTRANLLRALASHPPVPAIDDATLRRRVISALGESAWASALDPAGVTVGHGVIHLWGPMPDPELRRALLAATAAIEGVRGVVDHMTEA